MYKFTCTNIMLKISSVSLLGRSSTMWATPQVLSSLIIFQTGCLFIPWAAWTVILLYMLPRIAEDDRGTSAHPAIGGNVVPLSFCPCWPWIMVLPISISWLATISVLSHHTQPWNFLSDTFHLHKWNSIFFKYKCIWNKITFHGKMKENNKKRSSSGRAPI